MRGTDLVIEASQAVFEWSARHECCLGGTHRATKLRSDREGARKGRSPTVVVCLADLVFKPSAVTFGIRLRRFVKKKNETLL